VFAEPELGGLPAPPKAPKPPPPKATPPPNSPPGVEELAGVSTPAPNPVPNATPPPKPPVAGGVAALVPPTLPKGNAATPPPPKGDATAVAPKGDAAEEPPPKGDDAAAAAAPHASVKPWLAGGVAVMVPPPKSGLPGVAAPTTGLALGCWPNGWLVGVAVAAPNSPQAGACIAPASRISASALDHTGLIGCAKTAPRSQTATFDET